MTARASAYHPEDSDAPERTFRRSACFGWCRRKNDGAGRLCYGNWCVKANCGLRYHHSQSHGAANRLRTAHELGYYVLLHVPKSIAFLAGLLLVFFYLGYWLIGWILARWGSKWTIRGLDDWASLPALLFLLSVFSFVANPVANAYSRHQEHQADQYGLEVTHGLTPDSGQVAAQAFQKLGEVDLADPDPNPVDVFLFYDHPTMPDRVQFSLTYDPWATGRSGEFAK